MNGVAGWEDCREDKGVGAADSAVARVDERSIVVDKAMVAATSMVGRDGGGTTGGALGLGVGVGANVTWGLVRRAGVLVDILGPLLRLAEKRLRIAPGRELLDTGGMSSSSTKGCRRLIQTAVCH